MNSLTNGRQFLDAASPLRHTRTYPCTTEELPRSGRTLWWGYFRAGERIRFDVSVSGGAADAHILDVGMQLQATSRVDSDGVELEANVERDGIVYVRVDGRMGQSVTFSVDVDEPKVCERAARRRHSTLGRLLRALA